jgi:hypothetical protein
MSFFFFYRIREQESGGDWYQWEGEEGGKRLWKGEYSANTVYTYVKMIPDETVSRMGERGDKGE